MKNNNPRVVDHKLNEIYEYEYFKNNFKEILNLIQINLDI